MGYENICGNNCFTYLKLFHIIYSSEPNFHPSVRGDRIAKNVDWFHEPEIKSMNYKIDMSLLGWDMNCFAQCQDNVTGLIC